MHHKKEKHTYPKEKAHQNLHKLLSNNFIRRKKMRNSHVFLWLLAAPFVSCGFDKSGICVDYDSDGTNCRDVDEESVCTPNESFYSAAWETCEEYCATSNCATGTNASGGSCDTYNDTQSYFYDPQYDTFCWQAGLYATCGLTDEASQTCSLLSSFLQETGGQSNVCPYC